MGFKKFIKKQISEKVKEPQIQRAQELASLSDEELRLYVPDVYQEDIYLIDYQRLWN